MKKFTKALALLMALAMVFALAACSGGGDTGESSNNNASEAPKSTFAPVAKGQIKVGVSTLEIRRTPPATPTRMTKELWTCRKRSACKTTRLFARITLTTRIKKRLKLPLGNVIEEGCNIIFGTSYGYMDTMEQLAAEYPEVIFSHCSGYKNNGKNLTIISAASMRLVISPALQPA